MPYILVVLWLCMIPIFRAHILQYRKSGFGNGLTLPSRSPIPIIPSFEVKEVGRRVVTDIDDTVKSSGGIRVGNISLGGVDTQYSRGTFYPGAFQFAFELARGRSRLSSSCPPSISVLTARARELKLFLAIRNSGKLATQYRKVGLSRGHDNWGIGKVYYGSIMEWILHSRKGLRKFHNFERLLKDDQQNHQISEYVFIGDTGEKDEEASERIAEKYPDKIRAVFLHHVSHEKKDKLPVDRVHNGVPFFYFNTYIGAARKAFLNRLIGLDGLFRVAVQAKQDIEEIQRQKEKNRKIICKEIVDGDDNKASSDNNEDATHKLKLPWKNFSHSRQTRRQLRFLNSFHCGIQEFEHDMKDAIDIFNQRLCFHQAKSLRASNTKEEV